MSVKQDKTLIYLGEWYDLPFAEFAFDKESEDLRNYFLQAEYKVSDTGETYRVINSWDSSGLLFDNINRENGWRKFTLTEYVWIAILRELRSIGYSAKALKRLKT